MLPDFWKTVVVWKGLKLRPIESDAQMKISTGNLWCDIKTAVSLNCIQKNLMFIGPCIILRVE